MNPEGMSMTASGSVQGGPVTTLVQQVDSHIERLSSMVCELEQRLEPILRPPVPQPGDPAKVEPTPGDSGVAQRLGVMACKLRDLQSAMNSLTMRVEV